jgi:hypothetical protein
MGIGLGVVEFWGSSFLICVFENAEGGKVLSEKVAARGDFCREWTGGDAPVGCVETRMQSKPKLAMDEAG